MLYSAIDMIRDYYLPHVNTIPCITLYHSRLWCWWWRLSLKEQYIDGSGVNAIDTDKRYLLPHACTFAVFGSRVASCVWKELDSCWDSFSFSSAQCRSSSASISCLLDSARSLRMSICWRSCGSCDVVDICCSLAS